jgi:pilus assembly protein CpaE
VASYLELHNPYGIAEVLAHRDVIDYHLIRSTAVRYGERLHALLSPASANGMASPPLRTEKIEQALRACRQAYPMTVVDAPRVGLDVAATLAHVSEAVWIVLQPAVKDIRMTKTLHAGLEGRGVPRDRIRLVVNRYKKSRQMISVEEIQKVLQDVPLALLSNDYASVIRGINYGQPLSQAAPRSLLRRNLMDLVAPLADQLTVRFKEQRLAHAGTDAGPAGAATQTSSYSGINTWK